MKRILLLAVSLLSITLLPAQGIYQLWGMTPLGADDGAGVIFNTDAAGNNFQLRHQFNDSTAGARPFYTRPIEYNGKFYGMTSEGGSRGKGVIFEWDPSTNVYTKKKDFNGSDGSTPYGSLTLFGAKFYGMTYAGGSNDRGVIFEWDPVTNVYTKKFDFIVLSGSGYNPSGTLTLNGGKFYGLTSGGIFEWDPSTNVFTPKTGLGGGNSPGTALTFNSGNGKFYGITSRGGSDDRGIIFEWDPATNVFTKKIDFNGTTGNIGSYPQGSLTLVGGKFYGCARVLFEWDPATNIYTKKLDPVNGETPTGSLVLNGSKLYGMTFSGGSSGTGVIFEWDPLTNMYAKKVDLSAAGGESPIGSLTFNGGKFYGMTLYGGSKGVGVIFEWDPATNVYTKKIDLNVGGINGSNPYGTFIQLGRKMYGMTSSGGSNDKGVLFEFDPATNVYTKKIDLTNANGSNPKGNSLELFGGKLYGMTSGGGSNGFGVIFEWDPLTNVYTKKLDFNGINGREPHGNLRLRGDKFYGMTKLGGINNFGVIFEWDPVTNVYTKKIDFEAESNGSNGGAPFGDLTLSGSKFYGMTSQGGVIDFGVIFEWDPTTNIYTKKKDFEILYERGVEGPMPLGNLTLYGGKFYGMAQYGGYNPLGNIFEWDPATNVYVEKINFHGDNGITPEGSLTLSGGKFYGMKHSTPNNPSTGTGEIFEWDPQTNAYSTKKFFNGTDGAEPSIGNDLALLQAAVSNGLPGSCVSFPSVTIDDSNNNKWVAITDSDGNAIAEIKANGNNLGIVTASMYINNAAVRQDGNKRLYLDRNITLTPQVQPASAVDIRLYIKGSEFLALKNALNSNGDSSGISSINDVVIYKNNNSCSPAVSDITDTVPSAAEEWGAGYVFTANTSSLSSFYFATNPPQACPGPVIQCNADTVVEAAAGHCGAVVMYKPAVVTDACENATLTQIAGLPSGAFFPVGTTINTFVATSSSGQKDSCSFTVTVKDKRPLFITPVFAFPSLLWPPNHKMKNVSVIYFAWDNCGPASCSLAVSSNEPVTGTGSGDKAPDWVIVDKHHVKLRAERSGSGNGRVYTITVTCTDASGNASTQKTRVFVPHHLYGYYSKGLYNTGEENDGYIDNKGDYFDRLFDCRVSPNPSRQNFNLEIRSVSNEKIEVTVFEITGRLISKPGIIKNNTLRFGDNLRPGVYMVEVKQGQQQKIIKVVKQ